MRFEPGLFVIDTTRAEGVSSAARAGRGALYVLSTGERGVSTSFFDAVRAVLPLDPPVHGDRNWDALADSMWEGLFRLASDPVVIVWPDAEGYRHDDPAAFAIAEEILRDLTQSLTDPAITNGATKTVSVYLVGRDDGPAPPLDRNS